MGSLPCGLRPRLLAASRLPSAWRRRRRLDDAHAAGAPGLLAVADGDDAARIDAAADELLARAVGALERGRVLVAVAAGRRSPRRRSACSTRWSVPRHAPRAGSACAAAPAAGCRPSRGGSPRPRIARRRPALAPPPLPAARRRRGGAVGARCLRRAPARASSSRLALARSAASTSSESSTTTRCAAGCRRLLACCAYVGAAHRAAPARRDRRSWSVSRCTRRTERRSKRNESAELEPTPSCTFCQSSPEVLSTMAQACTLDLAVLAEHHAVARLPRRRLGDVGEPEIVRARRPARLIFMSMRPALRARRRGRVGDGRGLAGVGVDHGERLEEVVDLVGRDRELEACRRRRARCARSRRRRCGRRRRGRAWCRSGRSSSWRAQPVRPRSSVAAMNGVRMDGGSLVEMGRRRTTPRVENLHPLRVAPRDDLPAAGRGETGCASLPP